MLVLDQVYTAYTSTPDDSTRCHAHDQLTSSPVRHDVFLVKLWPCRSQDSDNGDGKRRASDVCPSAQQRATMHAVLASLPKIAIDLCNPSSLDDESLGNVPCPMRDIVLPVWEEFMDSTLLESGDRYVCHPPITCLYPIRPRISRVTAAGKHNTAFNLRDNWFNV